MNLTSTLTNKIYNVAIYCRLSKDDGNVNDSSSIINQKEYLTEFVTKNNWNIHDYYIDDGYSGTNFNRPAFNRLITDIEKGIVNCVIVKDLSRFGRNYLEVGQYTEEYFPRKNVRFIALNDNFDTVLDDNDFIPFKNIINEWYAKDISKKIKIVFNQKRKDGTLLFRPPYGYKADALKGRVIDEEVAYIIRWIFEQYVTNNIKVEEIAKRLTQKQLLIPSYYYHIKNQTSSTKMSNMTKEEATTWTSKMVRRILKDKQYTGSLITNKVIKPSFKSHKTIETKKEDWIIHEDKFDPIIPKEIFTLTEKQLYNNQKNKSSLIDNKYAGIIICGHCNNSFKYRTEKKIKGYYCRTKGCKMNFISFDELDKLISNELNSLREFVINNELEIINKIKNFNPLNNTERKEERQKQLDELDSKKSEILRKLNKSFEAYLNEQLPEVAYLSLSKKYKIELSDIDSKVEIINSLPTDDIYDPNRALNFINNIRMLRKDFKVTKTLLNVFIDNITIHTGEKIIGRTYSKNIDITYTCVDEILEEFIYEKQNQAN